MNSNYGTAKEIMRYALSRLLEKGYPPHSVCSEPGEPSAIVSSVDTALDALFEGDDTIIYFGQPGSDPDPGAWILVIPENGEDVLSDWAFSDKFSNTLEDIISEMDQLKCYGCGWVGQQTQTIQTRELMEKIPGFAPIYRETSCCPHCGGDQLEDHFAPPAR